MVVHYWQVTVWTECWQGDNAFGSLFRMPDVDRNQHIFLEFAFKRPPNMRILFHHVHTSVNAFMTT